MLCLRAGLQPQSSADALSMNRTVVGQASRLPLGRLTPGFVAGETPAQAAGTAAPLRIRRFMVPMHAKKRMEAPHETSRHPARALDPIAGRSRHSDGERPDKRGRTHLALSTAGLGLPRR